MHLELFGEGVFSVGLVTFTQDLAFRCPCCGKVLSNGRFTIGYIREGEEDLFAIASDVLRCCDRDLQAPSFFERAVHAKIEIARIEHLGECSESLKLEVIPYECFEPCIAAMAEVN